MDPTSSRPVPNGKRSVQKSEPQDPVRPESLPTQLHPSSSEAGLPTGATVRAVPCLRWCARLSALATIGVMTALMIGGGFDPAQLKVREWILAAFFPLGLVFGLILGWRQEKLGGLIALGSLIGFCIVSLVLAPGLHKGLAVVVLAVPGLLFLLSAFVSQSGKRR